MNRPLLLRGADLLTPSGIIRQGDLQISPYGKIQALGQNIPHIQGDIVSLDSRLVVPGLIDLHVHGAAGCSVMDGTLESLDNISQYHAAHGTTAFLAATCAPTAALPTALRAIEQAQSRGVSGAQLLGCHLEGPFLIPDFRGAFSPEDLREPTDAQIDALLEAAGGCIRLVTLAPELLGDMDTLVRFRQEGCVVSIGHSGANYEECVRAVELGATGTTHHFNGMRPFGHREPGVAGAGLMLEELTTELICDGLHVHPAVVRLMSAAKGPDRLCLITDSVFTAGLPDGSYGAYHVREGTPYCADTKTLAGSHLTTLQALKNYMKFTDLPLEKAIHPLTTVPAQRLGLELEKGSLETGKDADFLILDGALELEATYVGGIPVYQRGR